MNRLIYRLSLVGFSLAATSAQARLYNYEDIPLGERAFGMGNTSMAVAGDVGGIFYNPSIMALSDHHQVSASLSAYTRIDTRTGKYVSLFSSAWDNLSRGGFVAVPSMVGGNFKTGNWTWGGAVIVPETFENSGTTEGEGGRFSSFEGVIKSTWVGAFLARKFREKYSFGIGVFYASRSSREKFLFLENPASVQLRFIEKGYKSNGIVVILGGAYEFNPRLRLGYSLRLPAWHWAGSGVYSDSVSGTPQVSDEEFKTTGLSIPARLSFGVSWQKNDKWLLAADLHVYAGYRKNLSSTNNAFFQVSAHEIANIGLGAEYMAWKTIGFRMGFFTNLSSAGELATTLSVLNDKVHMGGGTAAVVFQQPTGSISIGGYVQGGQGVSSPTEESQVGRLVPRSNYIYGFVVASSYKF